ncbi:NEW3 domain-containing protein [Rugosimonospora africana]|uniref:Alpha-mannosidase n=1 Tax=Rugosimonospora africana TaxID=556532 RepID=A0A8J3QQ24_9ACTN|nr:NEW3 domain-containing protein [Rugosimonospora africana]GIH15375.1 alpha-mannosidase [Rugosimonospora africana]
MSLPSIRAESTDLFIGTPDAPRQVLRVTLRPADAERRVTVTGPGVSGTAIAPAAGGESETLVEVGLDIDAEPGAAVPVTVTVSDANGAADATADTTVTVERTGYTLHMVSHFHYDPVWWNTQAAYTTPWEWLSGDASTRPLFANNSFALVDAHLDLALRDPDYRFVLAEIDYLKPYFDVHPQRREDLRRLLAEGRVELLGGTYNEPNTNLTAAETTIRNLVYGIGYQRDILGGDPRTAWQLDVFGHDPQFPGYAAAAGLTGSAWARGPFHQWGPILKNFGPPADGATVMQFPSEFEWIAPSGLGVLTHYMPNHYSAGWWMDSSATLDDAQNAVYELYRALKPVAATRHMLLPVGTDYTPPNKWLTAIHRSWNSRYVWPRFVCATPRDFLDAVRAELAGSGRRPSPQTRDMNPVYTGKDVSYIDTKQAQRAAEVAAIDAEKLATIATVLGLGRYPQAALDKVWRHLAFGAHHDAVTGSESDQVYIDLLGGWREAHDLAAGVRDTALDALVSRVDTTGSGRAVVITNTLSFDRSDLVRVPVAGPAGVLDDTGAPVPALYDRGTLTFHAADVPAMGWRTWRLTDDAAQQEATPAPQQDEAGHQETAPARDEAGQPGTDIGATTQSWVEASGDSIANQRYRVVADPAHGGALSSIVDTATGRELLRGLGNELRVYDEYPTHPQFGEGPWHLLPKGTVAGSSASPAIVRRFTGPIGERLVVTGTVDGIDYEQVVTLWSGVDRIDFRTRVLDHAVQDKLVRVRFPVDLPGALPVSEVAAAVVGRGYALPDVDSAEAPWTLDNPANTWFGLGSTARVRLTSPDGVPLGERAIGVAEVVVPGVDDGADARDLVVALARAGVTATTSSADGSRYGWLNVDSNLPDFRIVLGDADANAVTRDLLARAGSGYADALARHGVVWIPAERPLPQVWQPNADLRDLRALPALVVSGPVEAIVADLADATLEATALEPPAEPLTDATVALLTYGLPGFAVDPTGALHLSLLRSCTGWPSGVWIDPPRRTAPDGSAFQLQHWTHEFRYALVSGDGDWRALTLPARGQEYITPLLPRLVETLPEAASGALPATHSFVRVEPARRVLLNALKPAGNPIASGSAAEADPAARVTLRLAESTGLGSVSEVDGALSLTDRRAADLLERDLGPARLELTGFEVATITARPSLPAAEAGTPSGTPAETVEPHGAPADTDTPPETGTQHETGAQTGTAARRPLLGPAGEAVQPVYSRYWLHNRGPAPAGYLPVTVAASPGLLRTGGEPVDVDIVLASQLRDAEHEGIVTVTAPEGWRVEPESRVYRLPAGGWQRFTATVTPPPGTPEGLYFTAARLVHDGTTVEDVVTVVVGEPDGALPVPGPIPPNDVVFAGTTASTARETGLSVDVVKPEVVLRAGQRGSVTVTVASAARDEIRGEVQLVSPWGTWEHLSGVVRGFTVAAGGRSTVDFPVAVPADAEPGHAWAVAKVMWFGRCQYTPAVRLVVAGD